MNDKELDRLFRQKLEPMEVTPSANAWQQLEAGLQHKKQKKLWLYVSDIAAGLLLLLGTWGAFEYSQQLLPAEQMATNESKPDTEATSFPLQEEINQSKATEVAEVPKKEESLQEKAAETVAVAKAPAKETARKKKKTLIRRQEPQQALASSENQAQKEQGSALPVPEIDNQPLQAEALAINKAPIAVEKPLSLKEEVVISYKADEEPEASASIAAIDAAPEKEDKEISARKVFGFLKKVTDNSGTSLAELREAKNELLSLNRLTQSGHGRPE